MFIQVDGDTDTKPVQEDFIHVVKEHIEYIKSKLDVSSTVQHTNGHIPNGHGYVGTSENTSNHNATQNQSNYTNGHIPNGHLPNDTELEDLESDPIQTISQKVSNGNGVAHTVANGVYKFSNGHAMAPPYANGIVANGHAPMYSEHI